jgi:hypothetical protein
MIGGALSMVIWFEICAAIITSCHCWVRLAGLQTAGIARLK